MIRVRGNLNFHSAVDRTVVPSLSFVRLSDHIRLQHARCLSITNSQSLLKLSCIQ